MSETKEVTPKAGVITSAGKPERGEFTNQQQPQNEKEAATAAETTTEVGEEKVKETQEGKTEIAKPVELPELTDEQIKELFAKKGIENFENFDSLKEKIAKADQPANLPLTEEQKKAEAAAFEKRMLDFHIATGGTPEQFVALKQIAAMDLKELSVAELKKEMKESGFSESEIDIVLKERYFQRNPDELTQGDEESDEEFKKRIELTKKKVSYGSKKLESRSTYTKQNAEGILNDLREAIKAEDLAKQKEAEWLSKVDDFSKKVSRKITLELGEVDKTKLDPVQYDVAEADVAAVADILKDPQKRQQYFFNEDKTLNLTKMGELMLRNKILESAVKTGFIEGGNRQVAIFKKTFPGSAQALGVGGAAAENNQGRKGVIKSAGKPEVARPAT